VAVISPTRFGVQSPSQREHW